ncbi:MAG: 23S rRNA (uracil(1939)-C(5))-methyltransferase RlmD [Candidatus Latescibacterota bacterium]
MPGETSNVTVESLAYGGDGVAHLEGRVIFIPDALPGDVVRMRVVQDKGTYLRGELLEVVEPSPDRVTPFCPLAERCGGCQWQSLAYPAQLRWKRAIVEESLRRLGRIEDVPVEECLPSPEERGYRTVVRFPARQTASGLVMGYFERRSHRIVNLTACPLSGERANHIASYIRTLPGIERLDLREATIRTGHNHPSALVSFLIGRPGNFSELAELMLREIEGLAGVSFWRETSPGEGRRMKVFGSPYRHETVLGRTFRIEERSFFQINIPQTENLVRVAGEMIGREDESRLVDGYGGVGLFSLSIASAAAPVYLFDLAAWAIQDAVHNAGEMGFRDFHALAGDAAEAFAGAGEADRLIVDPPRTGLGLTAVEEMCRFNADRLVYVSCNPTTLARDLRYFIERGYSVRRIVPVDMFPQTYHVETIVSMSREKR